MLKESVSGATPQGNIHIFLDLDVSEYISRAIADYRNDRLVACEGCGDLCRVGRWEVVKVIVAGRSPHRT